MLMTILLWLQLYYQIWFQLYYQIHLFICSFIHSLLFSKDLMGDQTVPVTALSIKMYNILKQWKFSVNFKLEKRKWHIWLMRDWTFVSARRLASAFPDFIRLDSSGHYQWCILAGFSPFHVSRMYFLIKKRTKKCKYPSWRDFVGITEQYP